MILLAGVFSSNAQAVGIVSHTITQVTGLDTNANNIPDKAENATALYSPMDLVDGLMTWNEVQKPLSSMCGQSRSLVGFTQDGTAICQNSFYNNTLTNLIYNVGFVGVGNIAPTRTLHVTGDTGVNGTVYADRFCIGASCASSFELLGTDDQTFSEIGSGVAQNKDFILGSGSVLKAESGGEINATRVACANNQFIDGNGDCVDLYMEIQIANDSMQQYVDDSIAAAGGGDITAVQTDNIYITGGVDQGNANLVFVDAKLNDSIDHRIRIANQSMRLYVDELNQSMRTYVNDIGGGAGDPNGLFGMYQGPTAGSYNGAITFGGDSGYVAANAICASEYPGSHFCLEVEILKTITSGSYSFAGTVWMQKGAPGYIADANDCKGWTSGVPSSLGPFWNWNAAAAGYGALTPCSTSIPLACCGGG